MKITVLIFNVISGLYFFFIANFLFWGSVLAVFLGVAVKEGTQSSFMSLLVNIIIAPFLIGISILFFKKSANKYKYGIAVLVLMAIETQVYRFLFITGNTIMIADITNLLFYGIPICFIYITRILDNKYLINRS